jgi:hypothetical protein
MLASRTTSRRTRDGDCCLGGRREGDLLLGLLGLLCSLNHRRRRDINRT